MLKVKLIAAVVALVLVVYFGSKLVGIVEEANASLTGPTGMVGRLAK